MPQSDEQLVRDILQELGRDPAVDAAALHVAVQDAVAVLSGSVASAAARDAALKAALRVPGVRRAFQSTAIRAAHPALDDEGIAARVRAIFELDASVPGGGIEIAVDQGFVTLTGEVDWPYEREAARAAAARIAGVVGVTCRIEARGPPSCADLRGRILAALEGAVEAEAAALDIHVEDGVVRLGGTLPGAGHRAAAERAVREAPGVRSVESHLAAPAAAA